jgi:hypothetical protein
MENVTLMQPRGTVTVSFSLMSLGSIGRHFTGKTIVDNLAHLL